MCSNIVRVWGFTGMFLMLILVLLCQPLLAEYTDPQQRFSLEPPEGWEARADETGTVVFTTPDGVTSLMIFPGEASESEDAGSLPVSYENLLKEARSGVSLSTLKDERISLAGQPAIRREYRMEERGGKRARIIATFIKSGRLSLIVAATASEEEFARFEPIFSKSIQSLRFPGQDRVIEPEPEVDRDTGKPMVNITSPEERQEFITINPQVPMKFSLARIRDLKKITAVVKGPVTQTLFDIYAAGENVPPDYEWKLDTPAFYGANTVEVIAEYFDGTLASSTRPFVVSKIPTILDKLAVPYKYMSYDLLILTPQEFQTALQPLVQHKNSTGMTTGLMTLESIYQDSQYAAGRDVQEKIKLAIAAANKNMGVKYVMLVGDVDKFPVRYTRSWDMVHWGHGFSPSDLYYADLYDSNGNFDDWDSDNDNLFGEMNSGNPNNWSELNQDSVDLRPDVAVARIPASNVNEIQTIVNKIISYEQTAGPNIYLNFPPSQVPKVMLVTGNFSNPHPTTDQIANIMAPLGYGNVKHYYTTDWTTIPDTDPQWFTKRSNLLNVDMNNGMAFVVYMGHGSGGDPGNADGNDGSWSGWYSYQSVAGLNNAGKLPIVLAAACDTAMFHYPYHPYEKKSGGQYTPPSGVPNNQINAPEPAAVQPSQYDLDTMAEHFMVKHNVGGIAYMGGYTGVQPVAFNIILRFFEEFVALGGSATLGDVWSGGIKRYIDQDFPGINSNWGGWYAAAIYHHIQKMMIFGDPSLRIGGALSYYSICDRYPDLCKPLVCKNCHIKYIYKGDPIRFIDPRDRYILPIEEINRIFGKGEPMKILPGEMAIHIDSPTDSIEAAVYDDKGSLIVEDTSLGRSKVLSLRPERGKEYLLMLRPGTGSKLGVLYEISVRAEGR